MIRSSKYALVFCVAAAAAMVVPAAAADALPCAEYISTGMNDEPGVGHLVGTSTKTRTISYTIEATPGGVGSSTTVTETETYEVGTYDMGNDALIEVDCRDYSAVQD